MLGAAAVLQLFAKTAAGPQFEGEVPGVLGIGVLAVPPLADLSDGRIDLGGRGGHLGLLAHLKAAGLGVDHRRCGR